MRWGSMRGSGNVEDRESAGPAGGAVMVFTPQQWKRTPVSWVSGYRWRSAVRRFPPVVTAISPGLAAPAARSFRSCDGLQGSATTRPQLPFTQPAATMIPNMTRPISHDPCVFTQRQNSAGMNHTAA